MEELVKFVAGQVSKLQDLREEEGLFVEEEIRVEPVGEEQFSIEKEGPVFIVRDPGLERLVAQTDFEQAEALYRFQHVCRKRGLEEELIKHGIEDGDTVRIGEEEFYYYLDKV